LGGSHPGRGTRNALLALGGQRYLEILAPDPEQSDLTWHKEISRLTKPALVGWALRDKDVATHAAHLRARGVECIGPLEGSRTRPVIENPSPNANLKKMLQPDNPAQLHAKIAGLLGEFELTSKAIPSEAWTTH
jgi:hypothetical protein